MKKHVLLPILITASLTATQCMPIAPVKSFFSKYAATYRQAMTIAKKAQATFINYANKTITRGTTACLNTAQSLNKSKEALINRFFKAVLHGRLTIPQAHASFDTHSKWYQETPVSFNTNPFLKNIIKTQH